MATAFIRRLKDKIKTKNPNEDTKPVKVENILHQLVKSLVFNSKPCNNENCGYLKQLIKKEEEANELKNEIDKIKNINNFLLVTISKKEAMYSTLIAENKELKTQLKKLNNDRTRHLKNIDYINHINKLKKEEELNLPINLKTISAVSSNRSTSKQITIDISSKPSVSSKRYSSYINPTLQGCVLKSSF